MNYCYSLSWKGCKQNVLRHGRHETVETQAQHWTGSGLEESAWEPSADLSSSSPALILKQLSLSSLCAFLVLTHLISAIPDYCPFYGASILGRIESQSTMACQSWHKRSTMVHWSLHLSAQVLCLFHFLEWTKKSKPLIRLNQDDDLGKFQPISQSKPVQNTCGDFLPAPVLLP